MSYDAWKLQSPYDDPQFAEEEEAARDRDEALAEEAAAVDDRIFWESVMADERSSAEARWLDAEGSR